MFFRPSCVSFAAGSLSTTFLTVRHLPPPLRDWLPQNRLAFFLSDAIDAMDLRAFEAR